MGALKKLVPSILGWLNVVVVLALAPTIETYNGHVTTNVAAATNSSYMIGMTAIDDFAGFLMILVLLVGAGVFAVGGMRNKNYTVSDMLTSIGSIIVSIVALAMFSGSIISYIDSLITAGSGFAKTAYGIIPIILYITIIAGAGIVQAVKGARSGRKRTSRARYM